MIVIGGFNSSNTNHLVELAAASTRTYHIEDAVNLVSEHWIRHKPQGERAPLVEEGWLPAGPLAIGVTAGASTPDSEIGASIERILRFRGLPKEVLVEAALEGTRIAAERRQRERERRRSKSTGGLTPSPPETPA
jgi:4-hydroxy-3-methylbut-2-enyl diphosphate reductase